MLKHTCIRIYFNVKAGLMLNYVWIFLVVSAVVIGGATLQFKELTDEIIKAAGTSVTIAIGLIGIMAMWLGAMRIAEKAGIIQSISKFLKPVLKWLFPDVPENHPAMGSMVMNIAANMLGLSNAATPLGLRAMKDLQSLNPNPNVATNAMCTFLAINTSSVQLIPMTAIAVLAAAGSLNPTAIVGTSLIATLFSTIAGVGSAKIMEKWRIFKIQPSKDNNLNQVKTEADSNSAKESATTDNNAPPILPTDSQSPPLSKTKKCFIYLLILLFLFAFFRIAFPKYFDSTSLFSREPLFVRIVNAISLLAIPFLLSWFTLTAALKGVKVYEEFIQGAREGFDVAIRIIPYLVAILVAIGMFRGAGGIELLSSILKPVLDKLGFPVELLPMALLRPLSGSATLGIFSDIVKQCGADSLVARMAGTLYGSTETTFYVIAVYFGSVNIRRTRHSIAAGLIADFVGIVAAVIVCRALF
ncbi:MAG TPA: nucleoside recognition domain-containing protein [Verrucomicrobiota bacterium]|nr:nucleoside recognition domain-containing protein [Verrucomicrobiota bacterium]